MKAKFVWFILTNVPDQERAELEIGTLLTQGWHIAQMCGVGMGGTGYSRLVTLLVSPNDQPPLVMETVKPAPVSEQKPEVSAAIITKDQP